MALGQKIILSTLVRAEAVTLTSKVSTTTSRVSIATAVVALLVRRAHFHCQCVCVISSANLERFQREI